MGERRTERTLVLCVDRDDDVGVKAKVRTPIIGGEENLKVATKLALADPEEADANAMFEAVRLYEHLKATAGPGEAYEIATITGSPLGGVKADRKLLAELSEVLKAFPADGVILVTDGYADETVIPLIQSKVPIVSVKRVVVRHSRSIEETAALFSRYLRLLLENPRYSRIVLGLPGALILILVVLWALNLLVYAWMAILIGIGALLFVKGFGLDRHIEGFVRAARSRVFKFPPPHVYMAAISYAVGILILFLATYQVVWYLTYHGPVMEPALSDLAALIGWLCVNTSHMFVAGLCTLILGRCLHWFIRRDPRGWYGLVGLLVCAWSYRLLYEAGRILLNPMLSYTDLMATFLVGVLMAALATVIVNIIKARLSWPGRGGLEAEGES
ncbi:hypothetical protein DRO60_01035 [Candidatus Bathyarchaeota archaeon]|nr:MAG: hypothetical protein DRO60_01035 [Candidatus Bathyarchaeota archaeon]